MHKPRLLSDNGSSYVAGDLANFLEDNGMDHVRGVPNHPQSQGKIERWHQAMKNRILLENYDLPPPGSPVDVLVDHLKVLSAKEPERVAEVVQQWVQQNGRNE